MKIAILGLSGSGKSTLAKQLGSFYHAPVLHLDAVHFLPGWVERVPGEEEQLVTSFLDTHNSWVMDGNYTKTCYARRLGRGRPDHRPCIQPLSLPLAGHPAVVGQPGRRAGFLRARLYGKDRR